MKITLPLPPNMANSRTHWRVKNKQRKEYFASCDLRSAAKLTRLEWHGSAWDKARARATIYCGGEMDHDNALARLKWSVDWMVYAGYLVGDKPSQLEWDWPIKQVVKRGQDYRVEFDIQEAA